MKVMGLLTGYVIESAENDRWKREDAKREAEIELMSPTEEEKSKLNASDEVLVKMDWQLFNEIFHSDGFPLLWQDVVYIISSKKDK